MVTRALGLFAVGELERAVEGIGMGARQHGKRGETARMAVGDAPGDAAAPIMPDQMKAAIGAAARGRDVHGVGKQVVELIVRAVARVGPRARRVAALARRHRAIAGGGQRRQLCAPHVERFRKAMQQ